MAAREAVRGSTLCAETVRPAGPPFLSLTATAGGQVVFHHSEHCLKQVHHAVSNEEHRAKAPVPSDVA